MAEITAAGLTETDVQAAKSLSNGGITEREFRESEEPEEPSYHPFIIDADFFETTIKTNFGKTTHRFNRSTIADEQARSRAHATITVVSLEPSAPPTTRQIKPLSRALSDYYDATIKTVEGYAVECEADRYLSFDAKKMFDDGSRVLDLIPVRDKQMAVEMLFNGDCEVRADSNEIYSLRRRRLYTVEYFIWDTSSGEPPYPNKHLVTFTFAEPDRNRYDELEKHGLAGGSFYDESSFEERTQSYINVPTFINIGKALLREVTGVALSTEEPFDLKKHVDLIPIAILLTATIRFLQYIKGELGN
jgi:hypothetical protein